MGKGEEVVNENSHIWFDLVEEEESRWKKLPFLYKERYLFELVQYIEINTNSMSLKLNRMNPWTNS